MKKVILPFLLTLVSTVFLSVFTYAQQIKSYNVDQQIIKNGLPAGWFLAESRGYSFSIERHSNYVDKTQLKISSVRDSNGYSGVLMLNIPENLEGKEIAFEGKIKTENITPDGFAGLFLQLKPKVDVENMESQKLNGTHDWETFGVRLKLKPKETRSIAIGTFIVGKGTAWFADLTLKIDGKDYTKALQYPSINKGDTIYNFNSQLKEISPTTDNIVKLAHTAQIRGEVLAQNPGHAILMGNIKGNKGEGATLYKPDEISALINYKDSQFIPTDSTGHFYINILLDKATYFDIGFNTLYISPNDSIHMIIDGTYPTRSEFSGIGAEIQNYLKGNPHYKGASFLEGGDSVRRKLEDNLDYVLSSEKKRNMDLKKLTNTSSSFQYIEKARTKANVINSLAGLRQHYKRMFNKKERIDSIPELIDYDSKVVPVIRQYSSNFLDKDFLGLINYRYILYTIIKYNESNKKIEPILEWSKFNELSSGIDKAMKTSDEVLLNKLKNDINGMSNQIYRNAVLSKFSSVSSLMKGNQASDFDFEDEKGKRRKLSEFKGKPIFIDLWATWCVPCLEQKPEFERLAVTYKNKAAFLSISLDNDKNRWLSFLKNKKLIAFEGWSNFRSLSMYNVVGIPRYILIDKDFNIFNLDASTDFSKVIKEYFSIETK
ncbi:TlpA disulfide reductase family protein [Sphingobacterium sp. HMA12]|uniref:TlpA family protein disulfide reductase n=1 Tax=Sphingobacterium sp. HMA12 TaxID=2050894 RepID=UPI000CEA5C46|nr:TlpA disulfide reductase family protein [Sphingobacterium sp. HMA12]